MIPVVLNSTQLNPPLYSTQLKVIRWGHEQEVQSTKRFFSEEDNEAQEQQHED
jgi:hypothetical protein